MARVTIQELRELMNEHTDWRDRGLQPPQQIIEVDLKPGPANQQAIEPELANRTITYEGREATFVLDFDSQGLLVGVQIV